jgi:hypothetical protein
MRRLSITGNYVDVAGWRFEVIDLDPGFNEPFSGRTVDVGCQAQTTALGHEYEFPPLKERPLTTELLSDAEGPHGARSSLLDTPNRSLDKNQ